MDFIEIVTAELMANDISLCSGCDEYRGHRRGFVIKGERKIHLDSAIATRSTLHRALHEIGHIVNAEIEKAQKSWERERGAEKYATDTMRVLGVRVPRKVVMAGVNYVSRKKRHGNNISSGLKSLSAISQ